MYDFEYIFYANRLGVFQSFGLLAGLLNIFTLRSDPHARQWSLLLDSDKVVSPSIPHFHHNG
jgi:hypothetical protein